LAANSVCVNKLIEDSCRKIVRGQSNLPSMPDIAARILAEMRRPNCDAASISSIIRMDAGTTAYLLRIANSAFYGGVSCVRRVENAVARIGLTATRNLVTAHAMRAMYFATSPMLAEIMNESWRTSARLAALSSVLASRCSTFSPERAMLAGLFQDIGTLPILKALETADASVLDEALVRRVIERFSSQVGVVLLRYWKFDSDLVEVVRSRCDWHRNPQPYPDLADLVLLARVHERIASSGTVGLPPINELPAFSKFPLGKLGPDASLRILREAENTVEEIVQTLGA
jgi:HD-like signal output (HDOD) protein